MRALILHLEAPLMAFGGPAIDDRGVTDRFPAASLLTGLLANALGRDHGDTEALDALQARLVFAARLDRPGERLEDYQVADLSADPGTWTTRGVAATRGKGPGAAKALRDRHYLADACCLVALTLDPPDADPGLDALARALRWPARPLFLGRKPCLPSRPVFAGEAEGRSVAAILAAWPRTAQDRAEPPLARWPADDPWTGAGTEVTEIWIADRRDWRSQAHTGRRRVHEGPMPFTSPGPPEVSDAAPDSHGAEDRR